LATYIRKKKKDAGGRKDEFKSKAENGRKKEREERRMEIAEM
jgi:hypothetical protein